MTQENKTLTDEEIIEKVSERYGKMWDIKPNVLKGNLWWKDAIEDALNLKNENLKGLKARLKEEINSWYNPSIKSTGISLMITNGGYIEKFEVIKIIDKAFSEEVGELE